MRQIIEDARALYDAAVRRVQADRLLDSVCSVSLAPGPLSGYDDVYVAGMGKAAQAMAGVVEDRHVDRVAGGVVVVPDGYPERLPDRLPRPSAISVHIGGHPLPDEGSVRAGRRLLQCARAVGEDDLLVVLVSGGGTALSSLPVETVDLADLRTTYHKLLTAGVPIGPANAVRKHVTQVGGGQLAQAAHPGDVGALVVSDVVGDDLATIASGPTVPDPTTYDDAIQVLQQYEVWPEVPEAVRSHLRDGTRGSHPETPSANAPCFNHGRTQLIGTNETALRAARDEAEARGYHVRTVSAGVTGEARQVGRDHARTVLAAEAATPTCWLWGGEPTVTVTGAGTGGRNQELTLAAGLTLENNTRTAVLLSGGTDGIDGPTDAAGAWVTPTSMKTARERGYNPEAHLQDNDSYPVFDGLDQLLRPGPTHTNVMDVHVGLTRPS